MRRNGRITNGRWSGWTTLRDSDTFIPNTGAHPAGMTPTRRALVRHNSPRTGVGRFRSCLYKWGMASSAAYECGAEEQTVDPSCPPMSNQPTISWTALSDVFG